MDLAAGRATIVLDEPPPPRVHRGRGRLDELARRSAELRAAAKPLPVDFRGEPDRAARAVAVLLVAVVVLAAAWVVMRVGGVA